MLTFSWLLFFSLSPTDGEGGSLSVCVRETAFCCGQWQRWQRMERQAGNDKEGSVESCGGGGGGRKCSYSPQQLLRVTKQMGEKIFGEVLGYNSPVMRNDYNVTNAHDQNQCLAV